MLLPPAPGPDAAPCGSCPCRTIKRSPQRRAPAFGWISGSAVRSPRTPLNDSQGTAFSCVSKRLVCFHLPGVPTAPPHAAITHAASRPLTACCVHGIPSTRCAMSLRSLFPTVSSVHALLKAHIPCEMSLCQSHRRSEGSRAPGDDPGEPASSGHGAGKGSAPLLPRLQRASGIGHRRAG